MDGPAMSDWVCDGTDQNVCNWNGVGCNDDKMVYWISLIGSSISGTLTTHIGQLSNLAHLILDANTINGSLPTELG
jgi:hypothetical protein